MIAALLATVGLATVFRAPAEFEPQQSVWMSWPTYDHKKGVCVHEVQLEIIKALMRETKVEMLVHSKHDFEFVRDVMDVMEIPKDKAGLHQMQNQEIWIRDFGPQFVMNEFGDLAVADFNFNFWSYGGVNAADSKVEESVDRQLAARLKLPVLRSSMISEGGNREVNGKGTMLVVESVEKQRSPGMTRAEMKAEYRRLLGVTNLI